MNKYWEFALDADRAEALVKFLIFAGFVIGWLLKDWATGVVYGLIAPFFLIPLSMALLLLGIIAEYWPKKTG